MMTFTGRSGLTATICAVASFLCGVALVVHPACAQQPAPPPGYFDIPAGFDFPADKQTLEQFRTSGNLSAQRAHVWNVFAGMTQSTPDGKFAIFETWFSEDETFTVGPQPQASGPRRVVRRFRLPKQFSPAPGAPVPQAAGTALFSFVLYNFPGYNHVRTNRFYLSSILDGLQETGNADPKITNDKVVPAFPAASVVLKTVWWPIAKDKVTPIPIWDPELNPPRKAGNDFPTWARVVAVDPTKPNVPPNSKATVFYLGKQFTDAHVVGLNAFHAVKLDAQTIQLANAAGLDTSAQQTLGRSLKVGDYLVLVATHLTTKETDDWVWATLWWHDRPDDGPFAADRPSNVTGPWRNYLMSASYDLNLPLESDGKPHVTFNPWLEARFADQDSAGIKSDGGGTVSNCMNCHNRASYPFDVNFKPIKRGNPDLQNDPAYAAGRLRPDFLWSLPMDAQ
ncbi:MAG: hypothetical protein WDO17_19510 [Alphaproteobacteria bacterium]